jgi:hypothetical protein
VQTLTNYHKNQPKKWLRIMRREGETQMFEDTTISSEETETK